MLHNIGGVLTKASNPCVVAEAALAVVVVEGSHFCRDDRSFRLPRSPDECKHVEHRIGCSLSDDG